MDRKIAINFGFRWIIFFMLLEGSTVPLVALSNRFAVQNLLYMSIMGFGVAFICVWLLVHLLKKVIIKHSQSVLGIQLTDISGLWYVSILAGILLMIMFFVQDILYQQGWGDFGVGFASALVSVSVTLMFYELLVKISGFAILLISGNSVWQLHFTRRDIAILTMIFSIYEYFVCPITSIWVSLHTYRVLIAFASGLAGGGLGGLLLYLISRFIPIRANLTLRLK